MSLNHFLQYRKHRPSDEEFERNRGRAYFTFAIQAILDGVRDRRRKWTWAYFAERRDDRNEYVELFKKKIMDALQDTVRFLSQTTPALRSFGFRRRLRYKRWRGSSHTRTSAFTDQ